MHDVAVDVVCGYGSAAHCQWFVCLDVVLVLFFCLSGRAVDELVFVGVLYVVCCHDGEAAVVGL